MFATNACVVRDSVEGMIPATDVVPEDFFVVVSLEEYYIQSVY